MILQNVLYNYLPYIICKINVYLLRSTEIHILVSIARSHDIVTNYISCTQCVTYMLGYMASNLILF